MDGVTAANTVNRDSYRRTTPLPNSFPHLPSKASRRIPNISSLSVSRIDRILVKSLMTMTLPSSLGINDGSAFPFQFAPEISECGVTELVIYALSSHDKLDNVSVLADPGGPTMNIHTGSPSICWDRYVASMI